MCKQCCFQVSWTSKPGVEDANRKLLHLFVEECEFHASRTFHSVGCTWTGSRGAKLRFDNIFGSDPYIDDSSVRILDGAGVSTAERDGHRFWLLVVPVWNHPNACCCFATPLRENVAKVDPNKIHDPDLALLVKSHVRQVG